MKRVENDMPEEIHTYMHTHNIDTWKKGVASESTVNF
jgi:hypothetical protein